MFLISRLKPKEGNKSNELELALLVESPDQKPPQRKIFKWPTIKSVLVDQNEEQSESSTDNSQQQQQQPIGHTKNKINRKLEESLPRFGPCYGIDQPSMADTKEKSLEHVLKKTSPDDPSEAKEIYLAAMRKVEKEAREMYADEIDCSASEFRWMMLKDGCFFLQLVLLILGSPQQLGYPSNNLIFGKKPNKKDAKMWIESMLFLGNQIPFVVLTELMAQTFFKGVIENGNWYPPSPSSVCKRVLYESLILPALTRKKKAEGHQISDLLHGLHNLVVGPGPTGKKSATIEANDDDDDDDDDLEANNEKPNPLYYGDRKSPISIDDNKRVFPSATDLEQSGVYIKKMKSDRGVRSICFKSYYLWATLYLPSLPIYHDIEIVFSNLKTYETRQQMEKHKREVTSYLRLVSDLIQTSKDAKLLERKGIIEGSPDDEDELPEMLNRLSTEDDKTLTHDFRILRRKIRDYSGPPWARIKSILNVVAFLTLVQTCFTVLAYFKPPK